jgi:hypothetical protein
MDFFRANNLPDLDTIYRIKSTEMIMVVESTGGMSVLTSCAGQTRLHQNDPGPAMFHTHNAIGNPNLKLLEKVL